MTTSDNEWQRVVQRVTTKDNEWQRVVEQVTTNDNEWQRVKTNDNKSHNEWQRFDPIRVNKMADKNNKINDEKRSIELIRKVFKEEFVQQEKNMWNPICGNFSITKQ